MRISIIGPPLPIPPVGWGAVESLIWDMKLSLEKMGHEVQILNDPDPNKMFQLMSEFSPDFVHINYDDWIPLYPHIPYPCACTTHFAYLNINRRHLMGPYKQRVFDMFSLIKPVVFGLSESINTTYQYIAGISPDKLFLNPNGVMADNFRVTEEIPTHLCRSLYLAKIDHRKRQFLFQDIKDLYYAGNIADDRFDQSKNYLGEWEKEYLYQNLTEYANLVLLSDGEAHPLVCLEAFAAGLGVVISEFATANLNVDKDFITVIPEDRIHDISFIEGEILRNRYYSVNHRKEILDYSKQFEWCRILSDYYLPNIEKVINGKIK